MGTMYIGGKFADTIENQGPIPETMQSLLIKQSYQFLPISRSNLIPWTILFRSDHGPIDPVCNMDRC